MKLRARIWLWAFLVMGIAPVAAAPRPPKTWTLGEKKLLYIRVDFEDDAGPPIAKAEALMVMQQVDAFYAANSEGKVRLNTEVTPVLRLPQTAQWYIKTGNFAQHIPPDARRVAREAGYKLEDYQFEIVSCRKVIPDTKGKGKGAVGGKGIFMAGRNKMRTAAHELGHNFGLRHANLWRTPDGSTIGPGASVDYGNPFEIMGLNDADEKEMPRRHLSARSKNQLHWLADEAVQSVEQSGIYRIFAHDLPGGSGLRALKIQKDTQRVYWIEFRQLQEDNFYLMNGALVHWEINDKNPKHQNLLLDMTPSSDAGAKDAPLLIGRTFSDAEAGIHITPVRKYETTPPSLEIVVNKGSFENNRAPQVRITADSLVVKPNQPMMFRAEARDENGDALAYSWDFKNGAIGGNIAGVAESWSKRGTYQVSCTVSDMKGGIGVGTVDVKVR